MKREVMEYRPGFVHSDEELRTEIVSTIEEIATIPWLIEKGPIVVEGDYVLRADSRYVIAVINPLAT